MVSLAIICEGKTERQFSEWLLSAHLRPFSAEEEALEDSVNAYPGLCLDRKFLPNVLMHEFKGLLFADPSAIVDVTHARSALDGLTRVARSFPFPEDIDAGRQTAPSKRLQGLGANYGKIAHGARIAAGIGIPSIREACPHFNAWLTRLETASGGIVSGGSRP